MDKRENDIKMMIEQLKRKYPYSTLEEVIANIKFANKLNSAFEKQKILREFLYSQEQLKKMQQKEVLYQKQQKLLNEILKQEEINLEFKEKSFNTIRKPEIKIILELVQEKKLIQKQEKSLEMVKQKELQQYEETLEDLRLAQQSKEYLYNITRSSGYQVDAQCYDKAGNKIPLVKRFNKDDFRSGLPDNEIIKRSYGEQIREEYFSNINIVDTPIITDLTLSTRSRLNFRLADKQIPKSTIKLEPKKIQKKQTILATKRNISNLKRSKSQLSY